MGRKFHSHSHPIPTGFLWGISIWGSPQEKIIFPFPSHSHTHGNPGNPSLRAVYRIKFRAQLYLEVAVLKWGNVHEEGGLIASNNLPVVDASDFRLIKSSKGRDELLHGGSFIMFIVNRTTTSNGVVKYVQSTSGNSNAR